MKFLKKSQRNRNLYEFECSCGAVGICGVPEDHDKPFEHDCGILYVQQPATGNGEPRLLIVNQEAA